MDRDMVSGIGLIILGAAGFFGSSTIVNMAVTKLSGAFFPEVLFTIIALCGVLLIFSSKKKAVKEALPSFNFIKLAEIIVILSVYVAIMDYVGFLVATILFLVAAMLAFGERRPLILGGVSVVGAAVVYLLFTKAFMIVLPATPGLGI